MGRRLRFVLISFLLVVIAGYLAGSTALALHATVSVKGPIKVAATSVGTNFETVTFSSRDDHLTLRGWLFHAPGFAGRSVVLVHGWQGNRTALTPEAKDFVAHGYDTLLFDTRGEGQSDGDHETLGNLEQRDVLGAYDSMRSRHYAPAKMTFLGQSQGAAAIIEAAPEMPDVAAIVSDSAFADLPVLLAQQFTATSNMPGWLDYAGVNIARLFGADPNLKPAAVVGTLPGRAFLFIHSSGDTFIPVNNARLLKSASANPQSQLVIFPGKFHLDTYTQNPTAYMNDVYSFINSQIVADGR